MALNLLMFLIVFPLIAAVVLLLTGNDILRRIIVKLSAVLISVGAILLAVHFPQEISFFNVDLPLIDKVMFGIETLIALYIVYISVKFKRYLVTGLIAVQTLLMMVF
jgi:ech hydrogenase subunit A